MYCTQVDSLKVDFEVSRARQQRTTAHQAYLRVERWEGDRYIAVFCQTLTIDVLHPLHYIDSEVGSGAYLFAHYLKHVAIYAVFLANAAKGYQSFEILVFI